MFTGLVEAVGEVAVSTPLAGGRRLIIVTDLGRELVSGDSIAVNGVCLTAMDTGMREFQADVGPETLLVTTLGTLVGGSRVNLERPLRADGRLGGHFVQGHVDAVGRVEALGHEAEFLWMTLSFPAELARYIVRKGSIAVDGVSLTVARLAHDRFDVQLVPLTLERTNMQSLRMGDPVNLECDIVGKYVVHAVEGGWPAVDRDRMGQGVPRA